MNYPLLNGYVYGKWQKQARPNDESSKTYGQIVL